MEDTQWLALFNAYIYFKMMVAKVSNDFEVKIRSQINMNQIFIFTVANTLDPYYQFHQTDVCLAGSEMRRCYDAWSQFIDCMLPLQSYLSILIHNSKIWTLWPDAPFYMDDQCHYTHKLTNCRPLLAGFTSNYTKSEKLLQHWKVCTSENPFQWRLAILW